MKIKKGDTVKVITGSDKGKTGKVLQITDKSAIVEGVKFAKKHMRRTQENQEGGVIEKEMPINLSNLKKA